VNFAVNLLNSWGNTKRYVPRAMGFSTVLGWRNYVTYFPSLKCNWVSQEIWKASPSDLLHGLGIHAFSDFTCLSVKYKRKKY